MATATATATAAETTTTTTAAALSSETSQTNTSKVVSEDMATTSTNGVSNSNNDSEEAPAAVTETSISETAESTEIKTSSDNADSSEIGAVAATTTTTPKPSAETTSSATPSSEGVVLREWSYSGPTVTATPPAPPMEDNNSDEFDDDGPLEHKFAPGDHVIRWEMLPIVWPIQIHGIVLSVGAEYVKLVDFGLTTKSTGSDGAPPSEPDHLTIGGRQSSNGSTDNNNNKVNDNSVMASWNKFRSKDTEKQRIHVRIITERKELRAWQKVHYGSGLFGLGGDEGYGDKNGNGVQSGDGVGNDQQNLPNGNNKSTGWLKWGRRGGEQKSNITPDENKGSGSELDSQSQATDATDDSNEDPKLLAEARQMTASMDGSHRNSDNGSVNINAHQMEQEIQQDNAANSKNNNNNTLTSPPNLRKNQFSLNNIFNRNNSPEDPEKKAQASFAAAPPPRKKSSSKKTFFSMLGQSNDGNNNNIEENASSAPTEGEDSSTATTTRMRVANFCDTKLKNMNPAMAKLLEESKKKLDEGKKKLTPNKKKEPGEQDQDTKKANKLPKSDPPKVVLARATWLLEKGETVLPPYNIISSNSECIAVFCKTGVWSTLQSAVFLHSCSIGNAKSATALALGMLATGPLGAMAVGAAGVAAVAAPWILLKNSNDKCVEFTQRLTDLFWQQAKNEVFVECIEHWSGILDEDDKEEEEQLKIGDETSAVTQAVNGTDTDDSQKEIVPN